MAAFLGLSLALPRFSTPATALADAPAAGPMTGSLIVIDRHVHKTGGTTVRKIF